MDSITFLDQYRVYLDRWGIWLTVVVTEEGAFYVLRELCDALGIADHRQQYQQLLSHEASAPFVKRLSVQGERGGRQRTYCIHHEILGGWCFMVNPKLMRAEFRSRLVQFQRDARHALNRLLLGEIEGTIVPITDPTQRAKITRLSDWLGRPIEPILLSAPENENEE